MIGLRQSLVVAARHTLLPRTAPLLARSSRVASRPALIRPFSVLTNSPVQQVAAKYINTEVNRPAASTPTTVVHPSTAAVIDGVKADNLVFEIGLSFTVAHYQAILIAFCRTLFQAFRPLLILFIFSQLIKTAFFLAGAPVWFSFYSIWMFEVGYGLFQCMLSFLFIAFFYNNLLFARVRPALTQMMQRNREKLTAVARAW